MIALHGGSLTALALSQERLPEGTQTNFRSLLTDDYLRVEGSNGSIFALGDASSIAQVTIPCQRQG